MRRDDWLSSVVTKECFVLDESEIQSVQEHELSADSFYTCRLTNQAARLQNTLLNLGFRRVVSEVELHGSVVTETRVTSSCVVRRALPTDQKTIENIATNSFRHDRFHADALLDRSRADLIKKHRNWFLSYPKVAKGSSDRPHSSGTHISRSWNWTRSGRVTASLLWCANH
jgi:hypothetical protein